MMNAEELIKKYDKLKGIRGTLDSHLQEVADYCLPRKNSVTRIQTEGNKRGIELYDSTAEQSLELLAGMMHGYMTNPSSYWFEYESGVPEVDEDDDVRKWLWESSVRTHDVLNNSNFQTEVHEFYIDLGWAGTAFMTVEEDEEFFVRCSTRHISEYVIEENSSDMIDTAIREFEWTVRQIAQFFKPDEYGPEIAKLLMEDPMKKFKILHGIYPRDKESVGKVVGAKGYSIESKYVIREFKRELRESGYMEFPGAVARWTKASGETYGRSPAMKTLPDIKMANEMMKTMLRGAQKTVDPPLMVPDDGFVLPLKTSPGGLNYRRSGNPEDKIEPFGNDCRIDFGYQVMEDVRKRIREAFYVTQMQLPQGTPQMTAAEIYQRTDEALKMMGPMLGRQQSEFLQRFLTRVFGILLRRKVIQPPPEKLRKVNGKLQVRYSSQVARAQRSIDAQNIGRAVAALSPLVQLDPSVMDVFDTDKTAQHVADIFGVPPTVIRNQTDLKKIRAARAAAAQKAQSQQDDQHVGDMAQKMAPAIQAVSQGKNQAGTPNA